MTTQAADEPRFRVPITRPDEILAELGPEELRGYLVGLKSLTEAILAQLTLPELLRELLGRLRALLSVDTATVLLCADDRETLVVRASEGLEEEVEQRVEIPVGQGIAGAVAARRQAVIVDEVSRFDPVSPALRRLSSMMLAPLLTKGDLLGVLHVGTLEPRSFAARDLYLLQVVADRVALVIRNALLYDRAQAEARERERVEAAHREMQERFRVYAECASDAIFAIDEESVIQYANPAVERIFGYRPEELVGRGLSVLIPERMREAHSEGMRHFVETGRRRIPWDGVELPGLHRDGREVALEISFGVYTREGRCFFTGIARDVTERVRHQEELESLATELEATVEELKSRTAEAEAANRAKTDFLAVMSHELRTPLSAILGYAQLLELGLPDPLPEGGRRHVERIGAAARHQLALVEEILTFAQLQAGRATVRREPMDLAVVAREAVDLVSPAAAKKGLDVSIEAPGALPVRSDPARVRQVLANLLSNALKFTAEGTVRVRVEAAGDQAVVTVEDSGRGISPTDVERIFEPFWQVQQGADREAEGSGLGLTVSRRIAEELLGGRLAVESVPGRGSVFRLFLPAGSSNGEGGAAEG
ncbi:MAG TPA: ATP-binding protein [Longimicrobiaceae bacterium]|nr:ATP-binding protein [Longimicrobiaceae bacterium]